MKSETAPVKSARVKGGGRTSDGKQIEVGTATYNVYETVSEAIQALSETIVLSRINAQVRTDALNKVRAEAVGTPSDESLRLEVISDPAVQQKLAACNGDIARVKAVLDAAVADLKQAKGIVDE